MPFAAAAALFVVTVPLANLPPDVRLVGAVVLAVLPVVTLSSLAEAFILVEGAPRIVTAAQLVPSIVAVIAVPTLYLLHTLTPATYLVATETAVVAGALILALGTGIAPRGTYPLRPLLKFELRSFPAGFAGVVNVILQIRSCSHR